MYMCIMVCIYTHMYAHTLYICIYEYIPYTCTDICTCVLYVPYTYAFMNTYHTHAQIYVHVSCIHIHIYSHTLYICIYVYIPYICTDTRGTARDHMSHHHTLVTSSYICHIITRVTSSHRYLRHKLPLLLVSNFKSRYHMSHHHTLVTSSYICHIIIITQIPAAQATAVVSVEF